MSSINVVNVGNTYYTRGGAGKKYPRLILSGIIGILIIIVIIFPFQHSGDEVPVPNWGYNVTRNTSHYIHPLETTAIILEEDICNPYKRWHNQNISDNINLLIFITSSVGNYETRSVIRSTWASIQKNTDGVRVVFILGVLNNSTLMDLVKEESQKYGDIIQENFKDEYTMLTVKSLLILKWVIQNCKSKVEFVMKTDDDVLVNIVKLISILKTKKKHKLLLGDLFCSAQPIRDSQNKWYSPFYLYKDSYYPSYLSGTAYVMSNDVVNDIFKTSLRIPLFHLEDIYLTGIVAKAMKLTPEDDPAFHHDTVINLDYCSFQNTLTSHRITPQQFTYLWEKVHNVTSCNATHRKSKKRCYPFHR